MSNIYGVEDKTIRELDITEGPLIYGVTRKCNNCKKIKLLEDFNSNPKMSLGREYTCKECKSEYKRKRYHDSHDNYRERMLINSKKIRDGKKSVESLYKYFLNSIKNCKRAREGKDHYYTTLTLEEYKTFDKEPCYYCGDKLDKIRLDRVDNNIGYEFKNVVPCCIKCNRMKHVLPQEEFYDHVKKIYNKIIRRKNK